jgi:hypothetical protein
MARAYCPTCFSSRDEGHELACVAHRAREAELAAESARAAVDKKRAQVSAAVAWFCLAAYAVRNIVAQLASSCQ